MIKRWRAWRERRRKRVRTSWAGELMRNWADDIDDIFT